MDEQKEKRQERVIELTATVAAVTKLPSESSYGISQRYDRKLYDSPSARKKFHDEAFKGKKTIRLKDGTLLHRSSKAAKNKYGPKASYHQAQDDHIDPLKNIHQRHKKSILAKFLKDSDLQSVGERPSNHQMLSAHENASKGSRSEIELGLDLVKEQGLGERAQHIEKGIRAQTGTEIQLAGKVAKNIGAEITAGAKDALAAAAIPLVIRGTQDLVKVATGEMSPKDAIDDVGKLGLSIAASGGGVRVASFALATALKTSDNEILKKFAQVNQIGTVLVVGSIIVRAAGKYLSGEVDAAGFFDEIGKDGLSLVSGMLASKAVSHLLVGVATGVPAMLAPVLAAMIASAVCSEIYAQAKKLREEKKDNKEIRKIAEQASRSIRQQQEELARLLGQDHQQWVQAMTEIFNGIAEGLTNNNLQQTNEGLRKLVRTLHIEREIVFYEDGEQAIDDLVAMRQGKRRLLN